jgi:hypothetical protein
LAYSLQGSSIFILGVIPLGLFNLYENSWFVRWMAGWVAYPTIQPSKQVSVKQMSFFIPVLLRIVVYLVGSQRFSTRHRHGPDFSIQGQ